MAVDGAKSIRRGVRRKRVTFVSRADSTYAGVGAGRSAVYPEARLAARSGQRGTSGATTGPRGAAGPHNPEADLARSSPPNPDYVPAVGSIVSTARQQYQAVTDRYGR